MEICKEVLLSFIAVLIILILVLIYQNCQENLIIKNM